MLLYILQAATSRGTNCKDMASSQTLPGVRTKWPPWFTGWYPSYRTKKEEREKINIFITISSYPKDPHIVPYQKSESFYAILEISQDLNKISFDSA